jgi:hypothetical protein
MAWQMPGPDAPAREDACRMRCQAAVIEAMSELYDELGMRAQRWGEFADKVSKRYGTRL